MFICGYSLQFYGNTGYKDKNKDKEISFKNEDNKCDSSSKIEMPSSDYSQLLKAIQNCNSKNLISTMEILTDSSSIRTVLKNRKKKEVKTLFTSIADNLPSEKASIIYLHALNEFGESTRLQDYGSKDFLVWSQVAENFYNIPNPSSALYEYAKNNINLGEGKFESVSNYILIGALCNEANKYSFDALKWLFNNGNNETKYLIPYYCTINRNSKYVFLFLIYVLEKTNDEKKFFTIFRSLIQNKLPSHVFGGRTAPKYQDLQSEKLKFFQEEFKKLLVKYNDKISPHERKLIEDIINSKGNTELDGNSLKIKE